MGSDLNQQDLETIIVENCLAICSCSHLPMEAYPHPSDILEHLMWEEDEQLTQLVGKVFLVITVSDKEKPMVITAIFRPDESQSFQMVEMVVTWENYPTAGKKTTVTLGTQISEMSKVSE